MNYGLKVLLKEPFHYLKDTEGRTFLKLCMKYGDIPRHQSRTFKLLGKPFAFVDSWSFLWQYYDIFFRKSYQFLVEHDEPVIIDCGGNVGSSVLFFKMLYPKSRIQCFEADPNVYEVLSKNTRHLEHVNVHHKAVWSHNDGLKMELDHADGAHASDQGEVIPSVRLKEVLAQYDEIDLLKMDIEGAEFEVLRDCKDDLGHVERLFVEIHTFSGQQQGVSEIIQIVEKAGFRYYIEQAGEQKRPLENNWVVGATGMDIQVNLYCVRDASSSS